MAGNENLRDNYKVQCLGKSFPEKEPSCLCSENDNRFVLLVEETEIINYQGRSSSMMERAPLRLTIDSSFRFFLTPIEFINFSMSVK